MPRRAGMGTEEGYPHLPAHFDIPILNSTQINVKLRWLIVKCYCKILTKTRL